MMNRFSTLLSLVIVMGFPLGIQDSRAQGSQSIVSAAEAGDAEAQFVLGRMYNSGRGKRENPRNAAKWFREAAKQGHVEAIYCLAAMIDIGRGESKNSKQAIKWYKKAAEAGHADAMYSLSKMYDEGRGVQRNAKKAKDWYKKAVVQWDRTSKTSDGSVVRHPN